ncbi:MAG: hypothetical protein M3P51_09665 [Chloroflexota bacterium]|nr:hypothetical protein [Chloroflexota bacterium]
MGAWGPAIFSDDIACDVRDDYRELIGQGVSGTEATRRLIEEYRPDDDPDDTVFWLGLAATQWRLGRLEEGVKERALRIIGDGTDLRRWEEEVSRRDIGRRRAALEKLREQLLSPQPLPKRVRAPYKQETELEVGDVWSYRLLSGRYSLLRVVGHYEDRQGRAPVVEVLDWEGAEIPPADEVGSLSDRRAVWPSWSSHRPQEFRDLRVIGQASKKDYPTDRLHLVARGVPVTGPRRHRLEWDPEGWDQEQLEELDELGMKELELAFAEAYVDEASIFLFWGDLDDTLRGGFGLR